MWRERQAELQVRRAELLARSSALRSRLGQQARVLERPLAIADRVRSGFDWLMAHPYLLVTIAALPLALHPRRTFSLALKLWWGWRMWQRVRAVLPQ